MKKKIINGILLVAMLFATTSAFVSCKDTDADYKSETDAKISKLENQLAELQNLVNGIKQCNCADKIAALQAAIDAIKIPSLDGYLKTADLPDAVKDLLKDYYTKAEVDALIQGINIPEGLSEATVKGLIEDALKGYAKTSDLPTPGLDEAAVKKLIADALKGYAKTTDIPASLTKEEIIEIIKETIETTESDVTTVYLTEVTSLSADQVVNPMFTFNTPFDVKANILLAYFGEKAKRDIYFPRGAEEPIVWKGDYIIEGTGNAGKLYVTVNPSSVDFSGKTLKLMYTGGDEAPVELTPLEASNKNLMFLSRGENAFYETYATIPAEKIAKAYVSWEPEDMEGFKDQIKEILNRSDRNKEQLINLFNTLYNLIIQNNIPAYRLQAAWGEGNYTYSEANIAAVAVKPLTFAFDLETEAQYDGDAITALEKLEGKVVKIVAKSESTRAHIWNFLNNVNPYADKVFRNINWAIQPTLLISDGNEISHPDVYSVNTSATINRYMAGEIKLLPTSWTAEILAPAFKKYVAVVEVDGVEVSADDPVNAGLLGQVVPGSVNEIPFTVEAGKTYKIQYSAVDYGGNIRNLYYYIRGFKNN